ncbi:MAG: CynX/NimT family MFS transporter [Actinomycetes bacterium]
MSARARTATLTSETDATRGRVLVAAWALLVALNLRPAVAALGPVLHDVRADLDLSRGGAGLLTTLPVLCFGLLAPTATWLGRRAGLETALTAAMAVLGLGILVRSLGPLWLVVGGTVVVGAGIAVGNVLVPALIKQHFPAALGLMTALFTMSLTGGAALAGGLTGVSAESFGWDWRVATLVWAVPAFAAALVWVPLRARYGTAGPGALPTSTGGGSVWRAGRAWALAAFMGIQALGFYTMLAWLPDILLDHGFGTGVASLSLVVFNVLGIAATLTVAPLATRTPSQISLACATCLVWAVGLTGLMVWPAAALVWSVFIGLGQGAGVSLAMTLMSLKASTPDVARELSGMCQGVGYTVAAGGPFLVGWLRDLSGGWTLPLGVLVAAAGMLAVTGSIAGRTGHIR